MATVRYTSKKLTFSLIWKDYRKESLGFNYPYTRKSCKWRGPQPPSCCERRRMEAALAYYAAEQEARSAALVQDFARECLPAAEYLLQLRDNEIAISQRPAELRRARQIVHDFARYLQERHPGICLHEIKTTVVSGYYEHLSSRALAYGTIKLMTERMSFVFRRIVFRLEDSALKYTNPFERLRLSDVVRKVDPMRRKILNAAQLHQLLRESLLSNRLNARERLQRFATIYLLSITGWRLGDVVTLRWEQVDLAARTMTLLHTKTAAKGIRSVIYITDFMFRVLELLRAEPPAGAWREYVFGLRGAGARHFKQAGERSIQSFFESVRNKFGLNESTCHGKLNMHAYTIHSLRGSVITHLTEADFSEVKINYLVGHAPKTIEQRHYLRLDGNPEKATRALLEHMEQLIDCHQFLPEISALSH